MTGPGKSRGIFVHYLVPLMGLLGLKGAPSILEDIVRSCEFLKGRSRSCETQTLVSLLDPAWGCSAGPVGRGCVLPRGAKYAKMAQTDFVTTRETWHAVQSPGCANDEETRPATRLCPFPPAFVAKRSGLSRLYADVMPGDRAAKHQARKLVV